MAKASVYFTLASAVTDEIKRELDTLPGVSSVSISDSGDRITVDFDTTGVQTRRIEKQLKKLGCRIVDSKTAM